MSDRVDVSDMAEHPVDTILRQYGVPEGWLARLTDELHTAGYEITPTARSRPAGGVVVEYDDLPDGSVTDRWLLATAVLQAMEVMGWRIERGTAEAIAGELWNNGWTLAPRARSTLRHVETVQDALADQSDRVLGTRRRAVYHVRQLVHDELWDHRDIEAAEAHFDPDRRTLALYARTAAEDPPRHVVAFFADVVEFRREEALDEDGDS